MTETKPTRAYDLLEELERKAVDEYITFVTKQQFLKRERIYHALSQPIPTEHVRRSKGLLAKPLVRAAVAEKIQSAANDQDLSPDRVIKEHSNIAFSNIADYLNVLPLGDFTVKSLDTIPTDALAAVKSLKSIPGPYGIRSEVVLHDKHMSLKVLTELMGLVATDRTPALEDYGKSADMESQNTTSEEAYLELLEHG